MIGNGTRPWLRVLRSVPARARKLRVVDRRPRLRLVTTPPEPPATTQPRWSAPSLPQLWPMGAVRQLRAARIRPFLNSPLWPDSEEAA
ncbi:hypothetical protein [Actinoalloteichus hymeniacidonis]|uniref:hypothetical protein n=1 Tax=Actinoalloteichus hymeniacidonis TaxID=340345 RepID=UPI000852CB41|nr:hypothetical protein [Actinoalloteichus hymeniacidonis]MBB5910370.1 hypothetical protein [Actinoalloteichus hymeniacidonis]